LRHSADLAECVQLTLLTATVAACRLATAKYENIKYAAERQRFLSEAAPRLPISHIAAAKY
jgi:hypothetical protein